MFVKFCCFVGGLDAQHVVTVNTTEFIYLNGSKSEGPIELPATRAGHCMVKYAGITILMGGQYVTNYGQF